MTHSNFDKSKWYEDTIKQLLKPCPVCGEKKDIVVHAPNLNDKEDVTCLKCGQIGRASWRVRV